ncbi:MAG: CO dehydrogenase/acetyl-CoA synthase complex subunit epsilon [Candidatus Methanoperedens sp.]|nr:CO dehydrogenase/acetyl-CoA synthase complex subunit epsilon [Candidatus Methanoperedens sp.]MCE8424286.1 CO dehydrogenase/acetyl-CoA synthase complex subunit epsilon [Candidatus Methanoperedens sp.]MCE8426844.1 CO dehydrogenase/acetyl-CoA synthase complex subunit epsilon [Candidatus Methanoperedens sp.]
MNSEKAIDTTRQAVPFDTGNIPGPKMARATMPAVAGKMLAKAKRPLLIVGSEIHDEKVLAKVVDFGKRGIQIAAVGNSFSALGDKGLDAHYINMHALASYLCDPQWPGLDGKGGYDLVVFFGITYYYMSQSISALKNFSKIKVVSIDKYYHPNADMSFGNLRDDVFIAALDEVILQLPKK